MNPASMRGTRRDTSPLRLNIAKVHVPLSAVLAAWAGRKLAQTLGTLLRLVLARPWLLVLLVAMWLGGRVVDGHGIAALLALLLMLTALLVVWWAGWPESFTCQAAWRLRGFWRGWVVYRASWMAAMATTGLAVCMDGDEYLPRRVRVASTGTVDRVEVAMLPGQVLEDWTSVAPRLAQTFGAQECRVRTTKHRQRLELWFLIRDPLTDAVQPLVPETGRDGGVDLGALPVALCEDGTTYRLRLLGTHVLVVGATGAGKGSVVWSTLHALGPAIRDGLVSVWCLDPKGGMELAPGRGLFARFVYGDPDEETSTSSGGAGGGSYEVEFARVLEDAVLVMRRRQSALRGKTRLHTATVAEPLVLVVVDEIASLTAYVVDRDAKRRIAAALSLLLSQGRAVGVSVIGAVQDPRKEILTVRDLFPTRIALRVSEPEHVGLVLGQGARDRGARCDRIPESLPGIGYVGVDGRAEPVRVRFGHVTDDHIDRLVRDYAPRPASTVAGELPAGQCGAAA
jgi:DNA segregation ATPase FtsK/SpoIIIE, S-DNA-T family